MDEIPEEVNDVFVDGEPCVVDKLDKLKKILHEKYPVSLQLIFWNYWIKTVGSRIVTVSDIK